MSNSWKCASAILTEILININIINLSRMCSLDEVPFKVALDSMEIHLGQKEPVAAPEIKIPDFAQILRDTKVRMQQ